jgi:hypothetical protein
VSRRYAYTSCFTVIPLKSYPLADDLFSATSILEDNRLRFARNVRRTGLLTLAQFQGLLANKGKSATPSRSTSAAKTPVTEDKRERTVSGGSAKTDRS